MIAATSRDLGAMVGEGRFRADLYYRLNVLPIRLPALRERPEDIEALVEALLDDIARRSGLAVRSVSAEALDRLQRQRWPGNARELRNVLEQAALMTDDLLLGPGHFALPGDGDPMPPSMPLVPALPQALADAQALLQPLALQVAALERVAIAAALKATAGKRAPAAKLLQMSRAAFYDRLARYPELGATP